MKRADQLRQLKQNALFDLLVIGGGATGLGVALDAASRGYSVALVERADFSSGTSSRSTKLVHGGVRYLKQGNIRLVRDALRERGRLLHNAPHLVHNLPFVIPIYQRFDFLMYGAGLKMYDALAGRYSLGPSLLLSRAETIDRLPTIDPQGLLGGVLYHDGQFDDARLAVTLARTAVAHGATVINRCEVVDLIKHRDRVQGATVQDSLTGECLSVQAKMVVNATGVFVDQVRAMEDPLVRPLVTVSQGIHLVLPARFLPGKAALMVPKTDDGRVLFSVPWHDRLVVGTTDTPRPTHSAEPRALAEETDFVLGHARRYLAVKPSASDVLSVFAGLRPLVRGREGASTASLARDHTIALGAGGVMTVTGGKWTTYRSMAEHVVTAAARQAGLPSRACATTELRLQGASALPIPHPELSHLQVYGSDASDVLQQGGDVKLHPRLPYLEAEVRWAARYEMACTVEDVLARRTRALLLDAQAARDCAPRVAQLLARELDKTDAWQTDQVRAFDQLARGYCFQDPTSRAVDPT